LAFEGVCTGGGCFRAGAVEEGAEKNRQRCFRLRCSFFGVAEPHWPCFPFLGFYYQAQKKPLCRSVLLAPGSIEVEGRKRPLAVLAPPVVFCVERRDNRWAGDCSPPGFLRRDNCSSGCFYFGPFGVTSLRASLPPCRFSFFLSSIVFIRRSPPYLWRCCRYPFLFFVSQRANSLFVYLFLPVFTLLRRPCPRNNVPLTSAASPSCRQTKAVNSSNGK